MLVGIVMRSQCPGPASTSAQRGYCASVLSLVLFCFPASRPHSPGLATAPPPMASGTAQGGEGSGGLWRPPPKASVEGRRVLVA